MADTAIAPTPNYNTIIDTQQKRIVQLEADLARYSDKLRLLKSRASETHHAAIAAAAAAAAHAPTYAHMQAMLSMAIPSPPPPHFFAAASNHRLPHHQHLQPPHTPDFFAPSTHSPAVARVQPSLNPPAAQKSPAVVPSQDDDDRAGKTRYWTEMEHNQFLYAIKLFGPKNYVAISQFVGTRTPKQVRTHAQKYQMKLEREAKKRRAQAAAVAAVANPHAAAAAAAAAAACCEQRMATAQGKHSKDDTAAEKPGLKSHTDAGAQSTSTCPTDDVSEMAALRDGACSPVSNDSDEHMADREVPKMPHGLHSTAPVPMCTGLKKNGSLGNLADYDDFMRRITTAVQDARAENTEMFDSSNNEPDLEILHTHPKTEQFEDSLLVDL